MRSIRTLFARIGIISMLATAVLVPATPASAHARLPRGSYVCYQFDAIDGYTATGTTVRIKADRNYEYLNNGALVGEAGRYRHADDGKRIRFTSGYLNEESFRGIHKRTDGDQVIQLQRKYDDGNWYNGATCTK